MGRAVGRDPAKPRRGPSASPEVAAGGLASAGAGVARISKGNQSAGSGGRVVKKRSKERWRCEGQGVTLVTLEALRQTVEADVWQRLGFETVECFMACRSTRSNAGWQRRQAVRASTRAERRPNLSGRTSFPFHTAAQSSDVRDTQGGSGSPIGDGWRSPRRLVWQGCRTTRRGCRRAIGVARVRFRLGARADGRRVPHQCRRSGAHRR